MNIGWRLGQVIEVIGDDRLDLGARQASIPSLRQCRTDAIPQHLRSFAQTKRDGVAAYDHPAASQRFNHTLGLECRERAGDGIGVNRKLSAQRPHARQQLTGTQRACRDSEFHLPDNLGINCHIALQINRKNMGTDRKKLRVLVC